MKLRAGKIKFTFPKKSQGAIEGYCDVFGLLKFIPLHVNYDKIRGEIECVGLSPLFEECSEGQNAPHYEILVHTKEGVVDSITVNNFITEKPDQQTV